MGELAWIREGDAEIAVEEDVDDGLGVMTGIETGREVDGMASGEEAAGLETLLLWEEEADDDEAGDEEALWLDDVVEWLDGFEDVKWELMVEECALESVEWEEGLEYALDDDVPKAVQCAVFVSVTVSLMYTVCSWHSRSFRHRWALQEAQRPRSNNELKCILTTMRPLFEEFQRREQKKESSNGEEEAFWLTAGFSSKFATSFGFPIISKPQDLWS